jgi:hypothetical protein
LKKRACTQPRIPRRKRFRFPQRDRLLLQSANPEPRPSVRRGAVSERNCAERSMWVYPFSRCGSIPPLLHITISEWRVLIARPDQSMNTHPPA